MASAHDARAKRHGADAQGGAPVVAQHASIHLRMVSRDVIEHGLAQVDFAAFQRDGKREQRHEYQRDQKRGNGLRDGIQREIQKRAVRGSQDEVVVAAVGVKAGEQALP